MPPAEVMTFACLKTIRCGFGAALVGVAVHLWIEKPMLRAIRSLRTSRQRPSANPEPSRSAEGVDGVAGAAAV